VTGKRPYRCLDCHWRWWAVDLKPFSAGEDHAPDPPDPPGTGLASDRSQRALDLAALDVHKRRDNEAD